MKLAVIFGGKSTEHDVSIVSGTSVIANLNKEKYDIYPIYINEFGEYYKYNKAIKKIKITKLGEKLDDLELIENIFEYLKDIDVIFPVLHGLYGEDGTIQGLFELMGKKYVGCKVLSSALCMDKVYTKMILERANINVSKGMYIKKINNNYVYVDNSFNEHLLNGEQLTNKVKEYLSFPVFVKPSNSGSSVGVNKVTKEKDLIKYLEEAFKFDKKVLIEELINGREVECAILGNDDNVVASTIGEVLSAESFYTFDSKYNNSDSKTVIPANIDSNIIEEIKKIAIKAYKACDCSGLSRVDFFIEDKTNKIILNEINTLPGFTEISMYPKLMENFGLNYSDLLDRLIDLAYKN